MPTWTVEERDMKDWLVTITLTFLCFASAEAAVFEVVGPADSGSGTLRDAVASANALAGVDHIVFAEGLEEIRLTSGQIDISESVIIFGPANGQRISGGFNSRILALRSESATLTIENLVLFEGKPFDPNSNDATDCGPASGQGGAVCAEGDLEITRSSFFDNIAFEWPGGGAIYTLGTVAIQDSLIQNNSAVGFNGAPGGGLTAFGSVEIRNSVVSGNESQGEGAGILGFDGVDIRGSEISNNSASASAGGVSARDSAMIINSTISGNEGAGLDMLSGHVTIRNSTIVRNDGSLGGGIATGRAFDDPNFYSITITSTILAENTGANGNLSANSDIRDPYLSGSLFGDSPSEVEEGSSNLFLDSAELLELADNGCAKFSGVGASRRCAATHAMPFSSPVRDGNVNSTGNTAFDQRGTGFARVVGPFMDIGALESTEVEVLFIGGFE